MRDPSMDVCPGMTSSAGPGRRLAGKTLIAFAAVVGAWCLAACGEPADPLGVEAQCTDTRWVGRLQGDACPDAGPGWTTRALSDRPLDEQPPEDERVVDYCVYALNPANPPEAVDGIRRPDVDREIVADLSRDCHGVGGLGGPIANAVWPDLERIYRRQVDAMSRLPQRAAAPAPIRVAVVDSVVDGESESGIGVGRFQHGRAVSLAIKELACPVRRGDRPGCVVPTISHHLGLPRTSPDEVDFEGGGYFGYLTELADAIEDAIRAWQHHLRELPEGDNRRQTRLVINLSVGWDPALGGLLQPGDDPSLLPTPIYTIYRAITVARCSGALVVAAAGNKTFGPRPGHGPLLPAAWGSLPAPDRETCRNLRHVVRQPGLRVRPADDALYDPLVLPVAALGPDDRPLFNFREGTLTPVMAPGDHAVVWDPEQADDWDPRADEDIANPERPVIGPDDAAPLPGNGASGIYSGSSMAAATVSGVAAAIWGYAPELSAGEVVDVLRANGVDIGVEGAAVPADVCAEPPCIPARRVRLCAALRQVCAQPGGHDACPLEPIRCRSDQDDGPISDGRVPLRDGARRFLADELPNVIEASGRRLGDEPTPGCGDRLLWTLADAEDRACPDVAWPASRAVPWAGPQPDDDPCSVCAFFDGTLYLGINDDLGAVLAAGGEPTVLEAATLTLFRGAEAESIKLSGLAPELAALSPGDVAKISDLPIELEGIDGMTVSFAVDDAEAGKLSLTGKVLVFE